MKRTGSTNPFTLKVIEELKKAAALNNAPVWKAVAEQIAMPTRKRRIVNLSRLNRYVGDGETVVVPGKVLGAGDFERKAHIAALAFSSSAKERIEAAKGKALSIMDLLAKNPKGKGVKIIG